MASLEQFILWDDFREKEPNMYTKQFPVHAIEM